MSTRPRAPVSCVNRVRRACATRCSGRPFSLPTSPAMLRCNSAGWRRILAGRSQPRVTSGCIKTRFEAAVAFVIGCRVRRQMDRKLREDTALYFRILARTLPERKFQSQGQLRPLREPELTRNAGEIYWATVGGDAWRAVYGRSETGRKASPTRWSFSYDGGK